MRMNRFFALLAALSIGLSLVSCSPSSTTPSASPTGSADVSPPAVSLSPSPEVSPETRKPSDPVLTVGSEPVDAIEFNYHYTETINNYFSNNPDSSQGGPDPSKPLNEQQYPEDETMTWADVFFQKVAQDMHYYIALFLEAKATGVSATEQDQTFKDNYVNSLKEYCTQNDQTEAQVLEAQYGTGMSMDKFSTILDRYILGMRFENTKRTAYQYTEEQLKNYYDANKDKEGNEIFQGNAVTVRHILLADKTKAQEVLAQFEAGDKTEDSFIALAKLNSEDEQTKDNGGLYADVTPSKDSSEYDDFDKWCFDAARKPGDYALVETSYGQHVLYFSSVGEPNWKLWSKAALVNEEYGTYANGLLEKYPLEFMQ